MNDTHAADTDNLAPLFAERGCLSIVIPVYNEEESVSLLAERIRAETARLPAAVEIIFIDDGSADASPDRLEALAAADDAVRVIRFRRNFGKAAALDAGFRAAQGDVVITMDADLQDDPAEIPRMLEALAGGLDVVSGWKEIRHDPWHKTAPSKLFNLTVGALSGVKLNDFNCGFKAYRAEALEGLTLYGELHRFIPVLVHWRGFRVGEIPVKHHARPFGKSKYGFERLFKGALDFLGVLLNTRFATRPLHIFGGVGIAFGFAGFCILSYLTALWFLGAGPIGDRPLLLLGMLLVMSSFQFVTIGLLGEFIQRRNHEGGPAYTIRSTQNLEKDRHPVRRDQRRVAEFAKDLKETQRQWTQTQQSDGTPASDIRESTPTPTRSTG